MGVTGTPQGLRLDATTRVVLRVVIYYAVLLGVSALAWRRVPRMVVTVQQSVDLLLGGGAPRPPAGGLAHGTLAFTVGLAMFAAVFLSLPVSWIYLLTRAKRGYQQSVVQTLVMLPMVVAGIVVLVKDSLALAFGLAGIVAAVRFRTPLDDSKDAVYVFLATGIGLAAAVDLPVAAVISICFNTAILVLWRSDFGRTPVQLEGRLAEQRLERARQLSRTGTFVARIDDEVFRDMTAEQLEGVAERARRRARQHDPEIASGEGNGADDTEEAQLLVRTYDVTGARRVVEPQFGEHVKRWRYGGALTSSDGTQVLEYVVVMKKSKQPEDLAEMLRGCGVPEIIMVELG
jgi:hypothetical protein